MKKEGEFYFMTCLKNLTGQKFGRLTVIKRATDRIRKNGKKEVCWECLCTCGKTKIVPRDYLTSKKVQSCGCLRIQKTKENKTKHGLRNTKIYRTWTNMKTRCYNSKKDTFPYYGGKGIKVCSEWLNDFTKFYKWSIQNGYQRGLTIDRINPNGNYEPSNCRWVTVSKQQNNKLNNHFITYKGVTHTLAEWSNLLNMNYKALHRRINHLNWSIEKTFTTPIKNMNNKGRK